MALRKSGQILAPKISRVLRQELVCIDSLGQNQSHHCLSFKSLSAPPTPHQSFETEKIYTKLSIHTCLAPFAEPITAPNKWTSVREITTSKQVNRHFHSSTVGNKDIKVEIQAMGESISEGTIAEVLKSEGDGVEEDETIAQIETDKVTIDVKAPSAGTIKELTVSPDDTVKVGQLVAIISEGETSALESKSESESDSQQAKPAPKQEEEEPRGQESKSKSELKNEGEDEERSHKTLIHFPTRMTPDGRRISELSAQEQNQFSEHDGGKQEPQKPKSPASKPDSQPAKSFIPWYVGKEQGTKLSQSSVLSQYEIDQIELGGADP